MAKEKLTKGILILLTPTIHARLVKHAEDEERPLSYICRNVLIEFLNGIDQSATSSNPAADYMRAVAREAAAGVRHQLAVNRKMEFREDK